LQQSFDKTLENAVQVVKVGKVAEDKEGTKNIFDPAHPDADKDGYVAYPNVNVMVEMAEMISASRTYEACATAFDAAKNMAITAMNIGK